MNLSEKSECSFTDLMNSLNVDTGKLSFHIRSLAVFIEQTPTGRYKLSRIGGNAIRLIRDLEAWASEAALSAKTSPLPIASFRKRALAFLTDFSIMFLITLLITAPSVFPVITGGHIVSSDLSVAFVLLLALLWLYSTLLEGFEGQSLGKRIVGLRVIRTDGRKLFYDQTAVRNFGKAFLLPFDLLIGLRLKDPRFIRYFDKFAGTTVIDLRV